MDEIAKAREARAEAVRLWKVHDETPFGTAQRNINFENAAKASRKAAKLEKAVGIDPKTGILSSSHRRT